jgi:hypothetical protein
MHNPAPTAATVAERDDPHRAPPSALDPPARFAPLCTRPVALAITTATDELGRPLVGVFVPDGELL